MKFIRYGSLVPQFHNISHRTYHTAPVHNGIYAFPENYVECFLLGGIGAGSVKNGRYRFLRDENGKKIKDLPDNVYKYTNTHIKDKDGYDIYKNVVTEKYQDLFKKNNINPDKVQPVVCYKGDAVIDAEIPENEPVYFVVENKPNHFEYDGNIWCHFGSVAKRNEILNEVGSWILVDINYYKKLLKKYEYSDKLDQLVRHDKNDWCNHISDYNSVTGYPLRYIEKDCYEVFIESIQPVKHKSKKINGKDRS